MIELHITDRRAFAGGHSFGETGAYERLSGRALFAVDPLAPAQHDVVDLDKAPRDAHGLVHFAADFMILKPVDLSRGNHRVFYDYGNRGHKRALQFFNDAPHSNDPLSLAHAGNGFFMRRGYSVAWVAWEGDMLAGDNRMVLDVPVATDHGQPITGRIRVEFIPDAPVQRVIRSAAESPVIRTARFRWIRAMPCLPDAAIPYDVPEIIPSDQWSFATDTVGLGAETKVPERAIVPSDWHIHYPAGFQSRLDL